MSVMNSRDLLSMMSDFDTRKQDAGLILASEYDDFRRPNKSVASHIGGLTRSSSPQQGTDAYAVDHGSWSCLACSAIAYYSQPPHYDRDDVEVHLLRVEDRRIP